MTRSSPLRLAWLIALLCAVSLRLLTPPGWMPTFDGQRATPLVICAGDGVHTITAPSDPTSPHPASKNRHVVCAFAGLAFDAAPQAAAVAAPLAAPRALALPLRPAQTEPAPTRRRPQSPRAPPLGA